MKNFTFFSRSLLLVVCLFGLYGASLQAQSCNFNANNIDVTVNNICMDSDPYVTVDFNNFFLDGEVVIKYEPVYNGFFQISGVSFITPPLEVVGGVVSFEIAEPRLPGFPNNFVIITEVSFTSLCTQTFTGNELVSNTYDFQQPSGLTFSNLVEGDPPCPGIPTGTVEFQFSPSTPNAPGFSNFNRFQVRQVPFLSSAFTTLNPPNTGPNNTNNFMVNTQGLVSGTYVYLINDLQENCETTYEVSIGGAFGVQAFVDNQAGCFGEFNGELRISPLDADPNVNGPLNYAVQGPNGLVRSGVITGTVINNMLAYPDAVESNLPAGVYNVFLTASAGGCTATTAAVITEFDEIIAEGLMTDPICGDETEYTLTFDGVDGLGFNGQFRLRDATRFDNISGTSTCFDSPGGFQPLSSVDNGDGSFTYVAPIDPMGCFDIEEDSTVTIFLELRNPTTDCRETFSYELQINAQPEQPDASAFAITAANDTLVSAICSRQDFEVFIADYDPAFVYDVFFTGGAAGANIDTLGAFAGAGSVQYNGAGTVVAAFGNNNNGLRTIEFGVTKTNPTTGCVSETELFEVEVRPEPVVTSPAFDIAEQVCSDQLFSINPEINSGSNANLTFDYAWTVSSSLQMVSGAMSGAGLASSDQVSAAFVNTSGVAQTATLTITPKFDQNSQLIGGGSVPNDCSGEARTITVTVTPQPTLSYSLTIGDEVMTLNSGDVLAEEICSGDDFLLNGLVFGEANGMNQNMFVNYQVFGDARFLAIPEGMSGLGLNDEQVNQNVPTNTFAIGLNNIQNNHPDNNAQVARIILTPYFESNPANPTDFPDCAGEPIELFLTINPTAPTLQSPQTTMVCSDQRVEFTIGGASGNMGDLETRITELILFDETNEFVVPAGADRIEGFNFMIQGANGGSSDGARGGYGAQLSGELDETELLPGDTVRVRKGIDGADGTASGNGGDATTMVVIAGPGHGNNEGTEIFQFVAAGGGGAGLTNQGGDAAGLDLSGNDNDGTQGQGPGGFGGTGYPDAMGGAAVNNGGGGGGGYAGGNGGDSQTGSGGDPGTSFATTTNTAPATAQNGNNDTGAARIMFTVVYDDIRFNLVSVDIPTDLSSVGENIADNDGEVDTILFGQQFINETNGPLDVTYVFGTTTEANCNDGGQVTVILTVEPEPTGFLTSGMTDLSQGVNGNYEATVCSGDGLDAFLNSMTNPVGGQGSVYFEIDTDIFPNNGTVGFFGNAAGTAHSLMGQQVFLNNPPLGFFESGIFNNSGADATITYTITPYINCIATSMADCVGDPFTLTVTVQPGFPNNQIVTPGLITGCSQDVFGADLGFDFEASQPNLNLPFTDVRLVDYVTDAPATGFTALSGVGVDTTGLANGGLLIGLDAFENDSYRNLTGSRVNISYFVTLVSDDGCESSVIEYQFRVRPEPVIDVTDASFAVCEGDVIGLSVSPAANSAAVNNFGNPNVTFDYFVTVPAGLVYGGINTYPLIGGDNDDADDDEYDNTTSEPQTVIYKVVPTTQNGCVGDTAVFEVTVLPRPDIMVTATQAPNTISGQALAVADTLTICSGSSFDFALTQPVTGVGVATRIGRLATANVTDGDSNPLPAFENNQPIADFTETLINTSNASEVVRYTFRAYNFGEDGIDDGGNGDDCLGAQTFLYVEVLPALTDPATLTYNYFVDGSFDSNEPTTDTLCSMTSISIRPGTTIDPASGVGFVWNQSNDGGLDTDSGFGGFDFLQGNTYFALPADRIEADLVNTTLSGVTFTYEIQLYTFGADGVDNQLAAGSDDCPGPLKTVTIYVEPDPVLSANITAGGTVETITSADDIYFYELCSGDDFSLGGLSFNTNDVPGRLKYVEFSINGPGVDEAEFLGITPNGPGVGLDINGFLIGQNNVQNTSTNPYIAFITLTPYYEADSANPGLSDDCAGQSIDIVIILNPEVTGVPTPQDLTVCSGEAVDYEIINGANSVVSVVSGSHDFATGNDFVFPDNAAFVPIVSYAITSADGGDALNTGQSGARGLSSEGFLALFGGNVEPGDTLRAVFGQPGADGGNAGSGGGGSALQVVGGPNRNPGDQGMILEQIVLGGGGGAGTLESAAPNPTLSFNAPSTPGLDGAGPGGIGGLGAPTFAGGAGVNNGGGGGGGWFGGNGGDSFSGSAGASGGSIVTNNVLVDEFDTKSMDQGAGSAITIEYFLAFDDVIFTVTDKQLPADAGFDASMAPLAVGDFGLDTLLNGETFVNNTDVPQVVSYVLSTGTEAACPGSEVIVNVTVEPNPTLDLASNGTMIGGSAADGYTATICSGDSLSAILSSTTMPTAGPNAVRARVINVTQGPDITIGGNNSNDNASAGNGTFGGGNRPAAGNILFYEGEITNVGTSAQTVEYTVTTFINVPGAPNCTGDTITLTVTVQPGFDGVDPAPAQFGLCSNVSLADAGFDVDGTQSVQIPYDTIAIDTVYNDLAMPNALFETVSSAYSGTPTEIFRSGGFFGPETYRNRTGGPVVVTYEVRLISADGCSSETITYNFRYTAEAVIDDVASVSNQLDTVVCNTEAIGLDFALAPNSAWFTNPGNVVYNIEQDLPAGLTQDAGATYPVTGGNATVIAADEFTNETNEPLTVTYTVTPDNNGCLGDAVTFTATVLPNPQAELTLTSLDSTASFSLENSRAFLNPNPEFGMCSGQALDVAVTDASSADQGVHMANVTITDTDGAVTGTPSTVINYLARVEDLGDSLSFAMGELVNTSAGPVSFTISYTTFFNRNGVAGNQGPANGDCGSNGTVEFDVVISPANIARVDVRVTDDNIFTPIPTGQDTLCSGDLFDLAVRTASTVANDPNLPAIDSFRVQVIAPAGMNALGMTEDAEFTVGTPFENPDFYFTRLDDLSWENTTPGIKTVTYIATPFSAGCAGIADTTTISYRPEVFLKLDVPAVCIDDMAVYPITAEDQNQASSTTAANYDWVYLGGDASFFDVERGNGNGTQTVSPSNPGPFTYNNTQFLRIRTFGSTVPGTAQFRIAYENDFGCTTIDTLTLTIGQEASAGTFDMNVPIQCEGNTPIILDDYLDNADPGGTWTQVGGPMVGSFNAAAGSFLAENLNAGGALVEFEFRYLIGDGASGCTPDSTDIVVQVQSTISAGTYVGTALEACQAAAPVNLFDALVGEEAGGTFVQLSGADNVVVDGADGIFDQTGVTPGTYAYRYEVAGRNGCPGDDETVVVEVLAQADCSEPVPCDVIELTAGFNVISFDVIPNDNSVEAVFADLIASQNLVQVVGVQASVGGGTPETFSFVSILNGYVGTITNGIQGGYGYIVQVQNDATIEVCGTAADPDFRPELQAGLNIVGYVPQAPEAVDLYFDDIIATNDLNLVRTVVNGLVQDRIYNVLPFAIGPLNSMTNGNGYLIDVSMAFGEDTWRSVVDYQPTSSFDQFHGFVDGGDQFAGETIYFTDVDGNIYGQASIGEDGVFYHAYAFGDLDNTDLIEGFKAGDKIYVSFRDELFPTGLSFESNWTSRRLDLDFGQLVSAEDPTAVSTSINVYPNPTQGITQVDIVMDRAETSAQLEVFNTLGQVVYSQSLNQLVAGKQTVDVNLTDLAAGAYQLRVFTNDRLIGHRQVIRR